MAPGAGTAPFERQAIRRVEGGNLSEDEIERLGLTLLRLEQQMAKLREIYGFEEDDLILRIPLPTELSWPAKTPPKF
jgi:hypothetical protein